MKPAHLAAFVLASWVLAACGRGEARRSTGAVSSANVPTAPAPSVARASVAADPSVDSPLPEPELVELDGPSLLRLVQGRGRRGAVVNIWASWCGPCRRELPMLRGIEENMKSRGLAVVLVSVDEPESRPELRRMLEAEGFRPPYYVARRPLGAFKRALHPTWPGMIPVTFLFDASGARRYFWGGPVHEHELLPVLDGFLAGAAIDGEARYELAPGKTTP